MKLFSYPLPNNFHSSRHYLIFTLKINIFITLLLNSLYSLTVFSALTWNYFTTFLVQIHLIYYFGTSVFLFSHNVWFHTLYQLLLLLLLIEVLHKWAKPVQLQVVVEIIHVFTTSFCLALFSVVPSSFKSFYLYSTWGLYELRPSFFLFQFKSF